MIVETRPLHKKKKRLAKQRSAQRDSDPETSLVKEFIVYNRFKELKRKDMEKKESEWEKELEEAMANSVVSSLAPIIETPLLETLKVTTSSSITEHEPIEKVTKSKPNNNFNNSTNTLAALSSTLQMCSKCQRSGSKKSKTSENIEFIDRTPSPHQQKSGSSS